MTLKGSHTFVMPLGGADIAWCALFCSVFSILVSVVMKWMQQAADHIADTPTIATTPRHRQPINATIDLESDGGAPKRGMSILLDMRETAAAALRARIGSLAPDTSLIEPLLSVSDQLEPAPEPDRVGIARNASPELHTRVPKPEPKPEPEPWPQPEPEP